MRQLQILKTIQKADSNYLVFGVFAVLVVLFYGNTLLNGFVADDIGVIVENEYIHSIKYLPKVVTGCIWEWSAKGCHGVSYYYRPVHSLSVLLTYQISSEPWLFHLVNLFYYLAAVFLLFIFIKLLTKNLLFGFFTALLFLTHPINSEVVNWVSGIPELTFTIFTLLMLIFYIQYRESGSSKKLVLVYLFYFFALLSKEPAALLPLMVLCLDILFFKFKIKYLFQLKELKRYVLFAAPLLIYFLMRHIVLGVGAQFGEFTLAERIHTAITLFSYYIGKLLYPYPLAFYPPFEIHSNFKSFSFFLSLITALIFGGALLFFIKKTKNILAFSFIWFAIFLFPVLVVIGGYWEYRPFERYVFVPGIALAIILGYVCSRAFVYSRKTRYAVVLLLFFIIGVSWLLVFPRNKDWRDSETLITKTLQQNPNVHLIRRELGEIYFKKGEFEKAKEEFEYLIEKAPDWKDITMAYKGLGDYWRLQGDAQKAIAYYEKGAATGNSPRDYVTHNSLGVLYMDEGQYLKGFASFCYSLGLYGGDQSVQENFNAALSLIESEYMKRGILKKQIVSQLKKSSVENLVYRDKRCDKDVCEYAISFAAGQEVEALPSFLITSFIPGGQEIEILNRSFNPETGLIILALESQYKDQKPSFLFPSCRGVYYEVANLKDHTEGR